MSKTLRGTTAASGAATASIRGSSCAMAKNLHARISVQQNRRSKPVWDGRMKIPVKCERLSLYETACRPYNSRVIYREKAG